MRVQRQFPSDTETRQSRRPSPGRRDVLPPAVRDKLSAAQVLYLQRAAGNTAVARMLAEAEATSVPEEAGRAGGRSNPTGDLVRVVQRHAAGGEVPIQRVPTRPQPTTGNAYVPDQRLRKQTFNGTDRAGDAQVLSDGSRPRGSPPHADPAGYAYIRQLKLTKFWIRFHLVNEKAGGDGEARNLVPASQRDNRNYEIQFEAALKQDVATAATNPGDYVFYGVSVNYPAPTTIGTQRQQDNQPFFPTSLNVYHEYFSAATGQWTVRHNGTVFNFQDGQPTDLGAAAIPITGLTPGQLQTTAPGYNWTAADLTFLQTLGGANKAEFEQYVEQGAGLGTGTDAAEHALQTIKYRAPGAATGRPSRAAATQSTISFAGRINNQQAIRNLAAAIARGEITL